MCSRGKVCRAREPAAAGAACDLECICCVSAVGGRRRVCRLLGLAPVGVSLDEVGRCPRDDLTVKDDKLHCAPTIGLQMVGRASRAARCDQGPPWTFSA